MAGKFRIFVDESPTSFEPDDKPLGQQIAHQNHQQQAAAAAAAANGNTITTHNNHPEDEKFLAMVQQQQNLQALGPSVSGLAGPQSTACGANGYPAKREPLGLRQPLGKQAALLVEQQQQQQQQSSSQLTSSSSMANSSSGHTSINEEDQENDISMASLGSDFVPSILHDDDEEAYNFEDHSFGDETGGEVSNADNEIDDFEIDEDELIDEELVVSCGQDEDEALLMELSQAFRQHDDSHLFKSTVYIAEIDKYLHQLERKPELRPLPNYMDFQNDIDSEKRAVLFNWLVEVSDEYELQTETLFICTSIIDRFLSKMSIPISNLQLLGVAAMFIASKYEEIYPPNLSQLVEITDETYTGQQICQMEQEILKTLNFRISVPTISYFLNQIFAFNKFTIKVYHLAEYLCYLSLFADQPFLEYYPSEIALAAVILAAHQLDAKANISSELKNAFDKSNLEQLERRNLPKGLRLRDIDRRVFTINKELPFCIESLRSLQERAHLSSSRLPTDSAVFDRYSLAMHSSVSLLTPPKVEDLLGIAE